MIFHYIYLIISEIQNSWICFYFFFGFTYWITSLIKAHHLVNVHDYLILQVNEPSVSHTTQNHIDTAYMQTKQIAAAALHYTLIRPIFIINIFTFEKRCRFNTESESVMSWTLRIKALIVFFVAITHTFMIHGYHLLWAPGEITCIKLIVSWKELLCRCFLIH